MAVETGLQTINLKQWIQEHRQLLKPPVGNAQIWKDREFIVMVVGGPNKRTDYHIDPAEELFYQLEGDITLKVIESGRRRDIEIREGEMLLLPANVPHSPRRPANTVGLVVERARKPGELENFQWYCEGCGGLLYDHAARITDITTQLKPIFDKFYGDPKLRTCKKCARVTAPPPETVSS